VLVTRADGGVLERAVYKPYGAAVPATSGGSPRAPELGFTGRRFEAALGLYDFGARFYDPRLGRFLQPDPVVPGADRPQALNRFAYAFGDPQGYTDPSGHWPTTEETWAGVSGFLDDYLLGPLSSFGRGFSEGFAGVWSAAGVSVASDIGFFRSAGQALGGLVATPFALARGNPFPDPQYRLGADPARAVSLEDTRAHVAGGIATHGILNDPSSATNLAERRLRESGVVLFNPSGGILNDLLESAVQLFAPGATDLDRALAALVPSAGRVPFAFGSSQGTLTVRNGLFLAALSGRRGVVEEAWFTGSPSNAAVSLVMAGAVGGAQLRNLVTWRDPVAALGQPWFTPVALGALATGNAIHPDESYQRHYGDF
jgi:RHS repeat-associated protein